MAALPFIGQPDRVNPFLPTLLGWEDMERLLARLVAWRAEPHKQAQSCGVHHAKRVHGGVIHF
jgi:hypothetical protein